MARRRMFNIELVSQDDFLEMPCSAQALYFHLGMRADDDGIVSSPLQIKKIVSCSDDDFKILVAKGYLIPYENKFIVITHWHIHNKIRKDRYIKSIHEDVRKSLYLNNEVYSLENKQGSIPLVEADSLEISSETECDD